METNIFDKNTKLSDMFKMLKNLNIDEEKEINILLLGVTGIGKSTFINAMANYLSYKKLKDAEKGKLMVLIPSQFDIQDKDYKDHHIEINISGDGNECLEVGASATQDVKTYVFPIGNGKTKLRIIDSPGIGDTRGLEQDQTNCENILAYLGRLQKLHAICCMFSTSNARISIFFNYCLKEILSRLHTSASNNLLFLFTNTRAALYTPGDTLGILRKIVTEIEKQPPYVKITLDTKNIFCFENDCFKYLAAKSKNIEFDDVVKTSYKESWNYSSKECWRMITYIVGDNKTKPLTPHDIQSTVSINEARRLIVNMSMPLADITQMIEDNIYTLERHEQSLHSHNLSLEEMRKKLHIPVIDLKVTTLSQPVTVCASNKCAKMYPVGSIQKWDYKQRCHDPCYLTNIPKEIVGAPGLRDCAAMDQRKMCIRCSCDFSSHMHVYYFTKTVDSVIEDEVIKKGLDTREETIRKMNEFISKTKKRKEEFDQERTKVIKYLAQFAHFLKTNAIIKYNDSYESYIKYMIERERTSGASPDPKYVERLEHVLKLYTTAKESFDSAEKLSKQQNMPDVVTSEMISKSIKDLYNLPHTGKRIKELVNAQTHAQNREYTKTEYQHPYSTNIFADHDRDTNRDKSKDMNTNDRYRPKDKQQQQSRGNARGSNRGRGQYNNNPRNFNRTSNHSYPPQYNAHSNYTPHQNYQQYNQRHEQPPPCYETRQNYQQYNQGFPSQNNQPPPSYMSHQNYQQSRGMPFHHQRSRMPDIEVNIRQNATSRCGNPGCQDPACYPIQSGCANPNCRDPSCFAPPMNPNSSHMYHQSMSHGQSQNQQYGQQYGNSYPHTPNSQAEGMNQQFRYNRQNSNQRSRPRMNSASGYQSGSSDGQRGRQNKGEDKARNRRNQNQERYNRSKTRGKTESSDSD